MSGDRKIIAGFLKRAYEAYFKVKLDDQDECGAPHALCDTCAQSPTVDEGRENFTEAVASDGYKMSWDYASDC
ncbi:hypothetical protein HAZT_HAZT007904 [Hyalella azteca]|uniref:Uncharacterized protein n=1 Tax=Hyalella azteca TaxID=294128 RepID=A0A6A0GXW4_HYAAZ|nr:hypothetical protein HAZT_HAZT007904 [Hyalella azteca]